MTLLEIVTNLDAVDNAATIFAKKPFTPESEAGLFRLKPMQRPVEPLSLGLKYFLEVRIAKETLSAYADKSKSAEQACARLIDYAIHDAYGP